MKKENTREVLLQQHLPPGVAGAEPHRAAPEHLPPVLHVLANGSADAGAGPESIALLPPPRMAQGGLFGGLSPLPEVQNGRLPV